MQGISGSRKLNYDYKHAAAMSASGSDDQIPVRDGYAVHPKHTAPEEMYWLSHLNQEELCEKYVGLRDDFYTLKKFSCKQEDKIKKLQTKLRKIIADKKKDTTSRGNASCSVQEMEYQDALESQQQSIRELRLKNDHLEKKIKLANIQLSAAKKNRPLLFQHIGARVDTGLKQTRAPVTPQVKQPVRPSSSPSKPASSSESSARTIESSVHQTDFVLPERVREILEEARKRILALEAERDELQEHLIEKQQSAEDAEYELQQKIAMLQEEVTSLREDLHDQGVREERETLAIVRAEREARTLSARTTALQEQLAVTEEKVAAEKSRKEALQNELERMTGKLLGAEHQLREMQQEYQKTLAQLQQIAEKNKILQKENEQLQKENEQLTILNKNIEQRGLAAENESLKTQIAHLESALQSDLTERGTFLEHMTSDKEALAKAEVEMKNLRESNFKLQEELEKATQKLNIYSKVYGNVMQAGLLDLTEKDLANIFMKHKEESSGGMSAKAVEDLRQAHSELQLLYREKMLELEKITSTLTSHAETYKALENQVAKVTQESQEKEADFLLTIKNLQEVIKRRDERCEKMEHQMLMITDKGLKEKLDDLGHNLTRTVNLGKHDNVLEFHIDKVLFEAPEFNLLKTFVSWTVPFSLEDPLQHTNVAIGIDARYNYSALYKFQMNFRNLVSLRDDNVTVSVYILLDSGHPAKVGECYLSFSEVLDHPRNTLHGTVQVLVAFDDAEVQHLPVGLHLQPGEVVGTMSYWFNLQRPCEEVIAQHMRTVGVLAASQHYQDFVPKASKIIESKNPVNPRRVSDKEYQWKSADHQLSSDMSRRRSSLEQPSKLKCPIPAPRSQSHASLLIEQQQTYSQESEETKRHQESVNSSLHTQEYESAEQVQSDIYHNAAAGSCGFEKHCPHSQSTSSSRPYNAETPIKTKVIKTGNIDGYKNHKNVNSKQNSATHSSSRSDPSTSHASDKLSLLLIDKKATRPKSATSVMCARDSSEESGRTSVINENHATLEGHLRNQPQVSEQQTCSSEESSSSDTMFEESSESDTHIDEAPQLQSVHKAPENLAIEAKSSKDLGRKGGIRSSMSIHSKRGQETCSTSSPRISNSSSQVTGSQLSLAEASLATDSEGVVAVVSNKYKEKQLRIYVEVCSLVLYADSSVIQDPSVEFLFVDYHGFLGLPPDQLETPMSLPKPPPGCSLNFNFGQEFIIDQEQHPEREQALVDLMKNRGIIKFTVTSEPPEELQDSHDCQDLGYAFVNLHELLKKGQDLHDAELTVESADDGSQLGVLCITLHIVDVLKHLNITYQ
ncbi:protein fantom isoform X3 [Cherax quadricarinatus]|uniref:protein fantom isoform X3 n=1 Tax=Cherax quadricarinatus TaxID=27406 RepID=UPI00387EBE27